MNDSPLLSKMDALLKKHRGGEAEPATRSDTPAASGPTDASTPPAGAWLPVLTDVIERGTPPARPHVAPAVAAAPAQPVPAAPVTTSAPVTDPAASLVNDTLAEQLMQELAPRLSDVMEKQVAAELRKNLDQTVATLLSELDINVREIVRDAVAEKLRQSRDSSS